MPITKPDISNNGYTVPYENQNSFITNQFQIVLY